MRVAVGTVPEPLATLVSVRTVVTVTPDSPPPVKLITGTLL